MLGVIESRVGEGSHAAHDIAFSALGPVLWPPGTTTPAPKSAAPHDNLHIANGSDLGCLLAIEYGFHLTMMAAGLAVVWALLPAREATERRAHQAVASSGR
jgi:hypothetical protein